MNKPGLVPSGWRRGQRLTIERVGAFLTVYRTVSAVYDSTKPIHPSEIACLSFGPGEEFPSAWLEWWFA